MINLTHEQKYNKIKQFFLGVLDEKANLLDIDVNMIEGIKIGLASPEEILTWSRINCKQTDKYGRCNCMKSEEEQKRCTFGEVLKAETINYRTMKPEKDGLFCEKIFGPQRDYECACGKYKRFLYKGLVCDKCGVEVITKKVRRLRMGHIKLESPVVHIWFYRGSASIISTLLDCKKMDLESVVLYQDYIVIKSDVPEIKVGTIMKEDDMLFYKEKYGNAIKFGMGAEALDEIFTNMDLEKLKEELLTKIENTKDAQKIDKLRKRLLIVDSFIVSGNRPEWMILKILPVLPPDLRPLVPLEGGRFASSDLNDLYTKIIHRNLRLKRLKAINAPEIIQRNEKRMLQEAVDALLDNSKKRRPTKANNNRPLKSLSDSLRGKQGRFRQNLLGKRVDYSGRSVIVVGPHLKFNECGLPKRMAIQLFEPFIMRKLKQRGYVQNVKVAKKMLEREDQLIFDILEEVVKGHPVLLNRAPTLHRISFQAFYPVLIDDLAIQLHPLSCAAFNADFDGDQMAVHVPLTPEAILECRELMLAENNILSPAHGRPIATPSQDMVLGAYYLTYKGEGLKGEGKYFSSPKEAIYAYEMGKIHLHAKIKVKIPAKPQNNGGKPYKVIETTVGYIIFDSILPDNISIFDYPEFANKPFTKKKLSELIYLIYKKCGHKITAQTLDKIKDLGFYHSTKASISIGIDDMVIPKNKWEIIEEAQKKVDKIMEGARKGLITEKERYNRIIDVWTDVSTRIAEEMKESMRKDRNGLNPIYIMAQSGARGSDDQIRQLAAMRGLMQKPVKKVTGEEGEIIETPILSNFREGLSVIEYFISTHGARKGLADTALKTADAGYLTRRLVDVAQEVVVKEIDCGTEEGIYVSPILEEDRHGIKVIEDIDQRIQGRVAAEDVYNPLNPGEIIIRKNELITEEKAKRVKECGIDKVKIRSVLTCQTNFGVCAKCYGADLTNHELVKIGTPVGIIAAQSIGEPGTQLTLRTFHIGGTAAVITGGMYEAVSDGIVKISDEVKKYLIPISDEIAKYVKISDKTPRNVKKRFVYIDNKSRNIKLYKEGKLVREYPLRLGIVVFVEDGDEVKEKDIIASWDSNFEYEFHREEGGKIILDDVIPGENLNVVKKEIMPIDKSNYGVIDLILQSEDKDAKYLFKILQLLLIKRLHTVKNYAPIFFNRFEKESKEVFRIIKRDDAKTFKGLKKLSEDIISGNFIMEFLSLIESEERNKQIIELEKIIEKNKPESIIRKGKETYKYLMSKKILSELKEYFEDASNVKEEVLYKLIISDWASRICFDIDHIIHRLDVRFKEVSTEKIQKSMATLKEYLNSCYNNVSTIYRYFYNFKKVKIEDERIKEVFSSVSSIATKLKELRDSLKEIIDDFRKFNADSINEIYSKYKDPVRKSIKNFIKGLSFLKIEKCLWNINLEAPMKTRPFDPKIKISSFTYRLREGHILDGYFAEIDDVDEFGKFLSPIVEYKRPVPLFKTHRKGRVLKDITGGLPRVQEIFEARHPKDPAYLAPCNGVVKEIRVDDKHYFIVVIEPFEKTDEEKPTVEIRIPDTKALLIREGDTVEIGKPLTNGQIDPADYLKLRGKVETQKFLLDSIQEVYRLQGVSINDKHMEVIISQMFKKYRITDPGDSNFVPGQRVSEVAYRHVNKILKEQGKRLAVGEVELSGITKSALETDSFLSAASFQETTKVLAEAAVKGKVDLLMGLKENIIVGHLIPAGTGFSAYRKAKVKLSLDAYFEEAVKKEAEEKEEMLEKPQIQEAYSSESEEEISLGDISTFDNE